MPHSNDLCRGCGIDVLTETDPDGNPPTAEVCTTCKKTVCFAKCKGDRCPGPHPEYPRNEGSVPEAEFTALKATLDDEAALTARINALRAARGETQVVL
jgi:hypothetical protein